tara:strand:+ start:665 stop:898 length:234 start_codon:yes stop_codon:yes gene_type:complete
MSERKHLGQMMLANCPVCGGNVASAWINDGETLDERKHMVGDWHLRGLSIITVDRYEGDPMPPLCTDREAHRKEEKS